jgi:hypothetical protein
MILRFTTFVAAVILVFSCGGQNSDQPKSDNSSSTKLHTIRINQLPLQVEIAQTSEASGLGLMFRENLPENQGMLFVFPHQQTLSFWMRNTYIPLDIAFIDEAGSIVDIQRMEPLDESKQYVSAAPALYALEVNAGWFAKHGIKIGATVTF